MNKLNFVIEEYKKEVVVDDILQLFSQNILDKEYQKELKQIFDFEDDLIKNDFQKVISNQDFFFKFVFCDFDEFKKYQCFLNPILEDILVLDYLCKMTNDVFNRYLNELSEEEIFSFLTDFLRFVKVALSISDNSFNNKNIEDCLLFLIKNN